MEFSLKFELEDVVASKEKCLEDTKYDDVEAALANMNGDDDFLSGRGKALDLTLLGSEKHWKTGKCLLFRTHLGFNRSTCGSFPSSLELRSSALNQPSPSILLFWPFASINFPPTLPVGGR